MKLNTAIPLYFIQHVQGILQKTALITNLSLLW